MCHRHDSVEEQKNKNVLIYVQLHPHILENCNESRIIICEKPN